MAGSASIFFTLETFEQFRSSTFVTMAEFTSDFKLRSLEKERQKQFQEKLDTLAKLKEDAQKGLLQQIHGITKSRRCCRHPAEIR